MIETPLTALAGITAPILLAPMGGVAGGRLAAAVSDAGGLGLIGGGYADPTWLARELSAAGTSRIGVGFITFALDERPDSLLLALDHAPVAIQLSFGDVAPYVDRIHAAGALLISQVQTVAEARRASDLGADVIIAQGQDSGGHGRPGRGTIGLVPAIVDAVHPIPVVAAGGLADGRGLAAALALGAAGISLGTRFYATTEAISDPAAAQLLVDARGDDTTRTPVFDLLRGPAWPTGIDGRALRNVTVERWGDNDSPASRAVLSRTYRDSDTTDYSIRALWAGEGVDLIHATPAAATVIADIVDGASQIIRSCADRLSAAPTRAGEGRP